MLFHSVNRPREAVLDSQLLVAVSKIARKQAQNVNAEGNTFDADAFMNAVVSWITISSVVAVILLPRVVDAH